MNKFYQVLKELRAYSKLSQVELADKLGVTQTAIAKWESGDREPSIDVLISIADFFDCTIDYLVGRED